MKTQAAAFVDYTKDSGLGAQLMTRERDVIYRNGLDEALREAEIAVKKHMPNSPNLQAYIERLIQTIGHECLDHFVILGQRHFDHLVSGFVEYCLNYRPHQALANLPLDRTRPLDEVVGFDPERIICHEALRGLLKHYERRAA